MERELTNGGTDMNRKLLFGATLMLAILTLAGGAQASSDLWLHVRVNEGDGAKVAVNLPVSMLDRAMAMIPAEHLEDHHFEGGKIRIDDMDLTIPEIRELWAEIKDSPDMTFVTVEDDHENVRVWKEGDTLYVKVQEDRQNETVDVKIPMAVIDALLSSEEEGTLDLQAAMQALVEHGEGELVAVTGGDEEVRVWVDGNAEGE